MPRSAYECRTAAELARWAAEEIEHGKMISQAIQWSYTPAWNRLCRFFTDPIHLPDGGEDISGLVMYYSWYDTNARRLALLLAAEMLEDDDAR